MSSRLVWVRRFSQVLFLTAFLALFAWAAYGRGEGAPVDLFLRADPLLALSAMLSLRQIIVSLLLAALPIVVVSLVMGRAFCGWICPMGTSLDMCERVLRIKGRRPTKAPAWRRVKFYLLIALLVTMLLPMGHHRPDQFGLTDSVGLSATYLLDPIALFTRTVTWSIFPGVQWGVSSGSQMLMAYSYSDFAANHPWFEKALSPFQNETLAFARTAYFRLGIITFLCFAGIIALGMLANRFWCRNLCPLGAFLGILGKVAPVRLQVSQECNRCLRCANTCKMGAITENPLQYRGPECISCYSCIAACPKHAISITAGYAREIRDDAVRLDRRRVLGAAGLGMAAAVLPKVDWGAKASSPGERVAKISGTALVRPPGARAEAPFLTACVRCGECMAVCPTNGLQPALGEGGLEALGTPVLVPRIGSCTQKCTACGRVCPTRAIEPFTVAEKSYLYMGTAQVNRSTCIAWAEGKQCVICDEGCSYDAIAPDVDAHGIKRPVVNAEICTGCGQCENICPVEPRGAIVVSGGGDKRHVSREEQRIRWQTAQEVRAQSPTEQTESASPYPL